MSELKIPQTLLQIAGADPKPARLAEAALVIIDAQREYREGVLLHGISEAVEQLRWLLDRARKVGTPIFHIVHHGRPGAPVFNPDGSGVEIFAELTPVDGEAVIVKTLPNSFAHTDLDQRLKARGIQKVIFVGFMTHMCVETTVRAALELGYQSTVVASACATRDLPDGLGDVMPATVLHRASLAALADRFAVVVERAEDLSD